MSPGLDSALTVLVYVLIALAGNVNLYVLSKTFNLFGSSTHKVDVTSKSQDNIYTELAAKQYAKAAEAGQKAQETALEAAKVNQHTEELRLERARLEKTG